MKVHQLEALLVWAQIHKLEIKYTKWPDLTFLQYIFWLIIARKMYVPQPVNGCLHLQGEIVWK